uniref:Carboxylesterase type B domain-containing protein n=1 Tax=Panagrolaimus davidi TaxID=227884 RepID=A0A914PRJ4_9BILA
MDEEAVTIEEFRKIYGITELSKTDKIFLKRTMINVMSDIINNYAWNNFMTVEQERGCQTWSFIFQHHNPKILAGLTLMLPMNTATHGTEIVYIFDHNMFKVPFHRTKLDHSVGLEMTTLITNFAKYGNPNGNPILPETFLYDFVWEPVTSEYPQRHLIISSKSVLNEEFGKPSLVKFSPYYQKLTQYFCDDKFWINKSDTV